jgi:hypothetical protein
MKKRTDRSNVTNVNFLCGNSVTIDSSTLKWVVLGGLCYGILKALVISNSDPDVYANIIRSLFSIAQGK